MEALDYRLKNVLEKLYIEENLSIADIAVKFNVAERTIRDNLKKNSIKIRKGIRENYVYWADEEK